MPGDQQFHPVLGRSVVFADQPADDPPSLDPGGEVGDVVGAVQWRILLESLVRPVAVVVPRVLGQDLPQVPLAEDQQVIETLAAKGAYETVPRRRSPAGTGPES
jgi:hypothetical protein